MEIGKVVSENWTYISHMMAFWMLYTMVKTIFDNLKLMTFYLDFFWYTLCYSMHRVSILWIVISRDNFYFVNVWEKVRTSDTFFCNLYYVYSTVANVVSFQCTCSAGQMNKIVTKILFSGRHPAELFELKLISIEPAVQLNKWTSHFYVELIHFSCFYVFCM